MTTTTREIVERLARDAGFRILQGRIVAADGGCSGEATESVERFWVLAMEHAAGICEAEAKRLQDNGEDEHPCCFWFDGLRRGADAIREAGK